VKVKNLHSWELSVAQAQDLQRQLAGQVLKQGGVTNPQFIAGVDISTEKGQAMATAAVVVLNYPELKLVETKVVTGKLGFPYIPGLLSFREAPLTLAACQKLSLTPDLILVDGQGLAHPRRFGIASHLGLLLDTPAIGCAKSRLCGTHRTPEAEAGSYADLIDRGEVIGVALRTRPGTTPVYVSIGHKVDLAMAIRWVLNCCRGYRIPEPLRLAHLAAGGNLKPEKDAIASDSGHQGKLF
jgi:deoxyribonuclease V